MSDIVALSKQWLASEKTVPGSTSVTNFHIIETLLAEIQRIEAVNSKLSEEVLRIKTEGENTLRFEVAEECAVICETADYVVRSYGCAREIRLRFGLATTQNQNL